MTKPQQFVTFYLDGHFFGIDVQGVQEVIRTRDLTPVPLGHAAVSGLLNLRGQIVTVIDLKERLDLTRSARGPEGDTMNVVVRTEGGPVSFRVDRIGDVLDVDESMFEPPPRSARSAGGDFVTGVYKLDGRILHVLHVEKLVDFSSRAQWNAADRREEGAEGAA